MAHPLGATAATAASGEVALTPLATPAPSRATALLAAFVLVLAALLSGAVTARPAAAATGSDGVESVFTSRLNFARASRGVPRLTTRATLVAVAREQAARMAARSTLFHNPNLTSDVTNWRWVGENVGYGPDALTVHVAFMRSPGHKANILDRDFTEVGIGAVVRNGRVWVAEVFRQPARRTTSSVASAASRQSAQSARSSVARSARVTAFRAPLRSGSRGAAVKQVQKRLGLNTTGYYNAATKAAVSRFQRELGWRGRGNVGPMTWSRLF